MRGATPQERDQFKLPAKVEEFAFLAQVGTARARGPAGEWVGGKRSKRSCALPIKVEVGTLGRLA